VLPEDFGRQPEPEPEPAVEVDTFDFSRPPAILPPGHRRRSILK
jgi:hypothetical protein